MENNGQNLNPQELTVEIHIFKSNGQNVLQ